jgi:hypothetical protein
LVWSGFAVLALAFGLSYTQSPLYYSNQHQYFLHGMAQAGAGHLRQDWLANTTDPTPLFTGLVTFTCRYLGENFFYLNYLLILGLFFWALLQIFCYLGQKPQGPLATLCFIALFVLVHSGLIRLLSVIWLGKDYPWFLQAGVAGQYLLGPVFQPSVFGVLLIVSLVAFLRDRPVLAGFCSALAADLHSTYLLSAAFLTVAYLVFLIRDKRPGQALQVALVALAVVAPVVAYTLWNFAPTSPEAFARAQQTLMEFRIPHHAVPARWADWIVGLQTAWVMGAIVLCRRTQLGAVLAVVFGLSCALTLLQLATGNPTIALLFPWRISAVLVPVATTVYLAKLVQLVFAKFNEPMAPWVQVIPCAIIVALAGAGVAIQWYGMGFHSNDEELPLLHFVRSNNQPGDLYLLPVEVPKAVPGVKGVFSTSFTPPPRPSKDGHLIAVDFQRFRLSTGAPLFVDFKSIPYKDVEVNEWRERLRLVQRWYANLGKDPRRVLIELKQNGITHIVMPAARPLNQSGFQLVYEDKFYRIYRLA